MKCPGCARVIDPARHGELTFDGLVWCEACRRYDPELIRPRDFEELRQWNARICAASGYDPVQLLPGQQEKGDFAGSWNGDLCLLAEADHQRRAILLLPPGWRLTTLCHELAHIFTGQDHTEIWARAFALLVSWVKEQLHQTEPPLS